LRDQLGQFTIVKRGVKIGEAGIYVMTVGHFIARTAKAEVLASLSDIDTVIILDEAHDRGPDTAVALTRLAAVPYVILATATPNLDKRFDILPQIRQVVAPFPRPFNVVREMVWGADPLEIVKRSVDGGCSRILIIVPRINEVAAIARRLEEHGFDVSMHTAQHALQLTKVVVASQIVDGGSNIPGVDVVINTGRMIVSHRGVLVEVACDESTAVQRAGRGGRFCDAVCYELGPIVDHEYESYPSFDTYSQDPGLWQRIFGITCPIDWQLGVDGARTLYTIGRTTDAMLSRSDRNMLARFCLRHDTPHDAVTAAGGLNGDDELHADILPPEGELRNRLLRDPSIVSRFIDDAPFRLLMGGTMVRMCWLRLRDGAVTFDQSRSPILRDARAKAFVGLTSSAVSATMRLPARARWAPPAHRMTARRAVSLWLATVDLEQDEDDVRATLRTIPTGPVARTALAKQQIMASVDRLAAMGGCSIYVCFDEVGPAVKINRHGTLIGSAALICFGEHNCRLAFWTTASVSEVINLAPELRRGRAPPVGSHTVGRFSTIPEGWTGVQLGVNKGLHPHVFSQLGVAVQTGDHCGTRAVCMALNVPLPRDAPWDTNTEELQQYALQRLQVRVAVIDSTSPHLSWRDPPAEADDSLPMVVVRQQGGHYELVVMPMSRSGLPLFPLRRLTRRAEIQPAGEYPADGRSPRQLKSFVFEDHVVVYGGEWRSWSGFCSTLKAIAGNVLPMSRGTGLAGQLDQGTRVKVKFLYQFACRMRATVVARLSGGRQVVLYPDYECDVSENARHGQLFLCELGIDGARLWGVMPDQVGVVPARDYFSSSTRTLFIEHDPEWVINSSLDVLPKPVVVRTARRYPLNPQGRYRPALKYVQMYVDELCPDARLDNVSSLIRSARPRWRLNPPVHSTDVTSLSLARRGKLYRSAAWAIHNSGQAGAEREVTRVRQVLGLEERQPILTVEALPRRVIADDEHEPCVVRGSVRPSSIRDDEHIVLTDQERAAARGGRSRLVDFGAMNGDCGKSLIEAVCDEVGSKRPHLLPSMSYVEVANRLCGMGLCVTLSVDGRERHVVGAPEGFGRSVRLTVLNGHIMADAVVAEETVIDIDDDPSGPEVDAEGQSLSPADDTGIKTDGYVVSWESVIVLRPPG